MNFRSYSVLFPFACSLLAVGGAAGAGCGDSGGSGGSGGNGGAGGATPAVHELVVLFTSDEHSHLFGFSPELDDFPTATGTGNGPLVGGVARRAAVLARERKAAADAGKDTITVSAGDNQMGTLAHVAFESASIDYGTMKALGYDVTTLGNHEFDFGPQALAKSIAAAKAGNGLPPIVATNIHFSSDSSDDDSLAAHYSDTLGDEAAIHPYQVMTTKGGLKVGVIGFVGVDAEHVEPNRKPVQFSSRNLEPKLEGSAKDVLPELYKDLQPVVDKLRNTEKVSFVIALSHAGINDSSSEAATQTGEDYQVAQNVSGIDLIISGHAHNADPKPIRVKNLASGKETLVLNASSYGRHVGRVSFMVHPDGTVMWDEGTQALLSVDETTAPDPTQAKVTDGLLATLETSSYLEGLLSQVTGAAVTNDASKAGDLYFYPLGKTAFDVTDLHSVLALASDAMLSAADRWGQDNSGATTVMGIESAGVIRARLMKGKTGMISAADAFNVVPLGGSPVDGTVGYPLARAYVYLIELRGIFEAAVALGKTNSAYDLMPSGVKVEYDATRPPALSLADLVNPAKGQVMKIAMDSNHSDGFEQFDQVIYDRTAGIGGATDLYPITASSYIAQFATDVGASLKDSKGNALALHDTLLHRADGSEIKEVEAFMTYIKDAPGGTLPDRYDGSSPNAVKRMVCVKGCL